MKMDICLTTTAGQTEINDVDAPKGFALADGVFTATNARRTIMVPLRHLVTAEGVFQKEEADRDE